MLSDPSNNILCSYRFTCGAKVCPEIIQSRTLPTCHTDKFNRYQPEVEEINWYQRDWEDVHRITWREVFSLQESWIYGLLLIIIVVFIFLVAIFIRVVLYLN